MKNFFSFLFLGLVCLGANAQIKGNVTAAVSGDSLSAVNVYVKDSYKGTTTNASGVYNLDVDEKGGYQIVFQYLGYKTQTKEIEIEDFPFELNAKLEEETDALDEVEISSNENPANRIIRKAIKHRKENRDKIQAFEADYYSKGNWTITDAPKWFSDENVEVSGLNFDLDSTGQGVLYLSETHSEIKYRKPRDFHENIIASKVSGNDNGFSWNSAKDADFSFYENTIPLNAELISPIASYAFQHYTYELENVHYDEFGHLINKVKVKPKRKDANVFSGYIYIVEDSWAIYGVELKTNGTSANIPPMREMNFNQSFKFDEEEEVWVKISQDLNFNWKLLGVKGTSQFLGIYSNYNFSPNFQADAFSKEILSFEEKANQKDSLFWEEFRPIPLTQNETADYIKKDSIAQKRNSKAYKDSVDRKRNKFRFGDILSGYTYKNSTKHHRFNISSPLAGLHFNTVQGWNLNVNTSFTQEQKEKNTFWRIYSDMSYGFADHRYRISGGFTKKFNNFSKPYLTIEGGVKTEEINNTQAIPLIINDVANILFERNYLKLYDKHYAKAQYSQELWNGFDVYAVLGYEHRSPLLNATDHVIRKDKNGGYTSNNPLEPENFESKPFKRHDIGRLSLSARYNIGQEYYTYPDGKYSVKNRDFPTFYLTYHMGLASSVSDYNYEQLQLALDQTVNLKNKGTLNYLLKGGTFFDNQDIALVDYKHFRGNQFRVSSDDNYVGRYNLMPFYNFSTNKNYAEAHLEHNFDGWILGRIPYINKLNFSIVVGGHVLWTENRKPYQEVSIGLDNLGVGLFRLLRVDYVHSFYDGHDMGAFVFGLKFMDML